MKQKDIALILVIVIISVVISIFISKDILSSPKNRQIKAEVVQPISSDFPTPDNRYFNGSAFDPAQPITVGQNQNSGPFNTGSTQ